ncbi:MAG: UDP-N-acetylmuramate--L-alanine ligase [Actinomycetota bacterium]|nr:UDP-N-acetylmuramate--L-alanine ligase [Actinomycetota bacterium]
MRVVSDRPDVPLLEPSWRVHLVGVGGAGMSALALILLERGHQVSGSDLRGGRTCAALSAMGATIHVGHAGHHVEGADLVATSAAIPVGNPELLRAAELGIPIVRRAELLAALIGQRRAILVSGTHGKTTTTSMTTVCLQAAGADPSFAIGGTLHDSGTSAHHGLGDVFVAEADESDRSFLVHAPHCAVVTNVEFDHHDHYADMQEVREAFEAFLARRVPGGLAVVCRDDPGAASLLERADPPVLTYGTHQEADLRIVEVALRRDGAEFRLERRGEDLGPFRLRLAGAHNVRNASAAAAAALWAGVPVEAAREGLSGFSGVARRFQRVGAAAGITVVDDYGHHPTELTSTLAAARQTQPDGRVVAVFQPHRFSRTAALGSELGAALAGADVVVVTDVYAAGEAPVPGVTGAVVAEAARVRGAETYFVPSTGDVPEVVARLAAPGDLVLTLGAGDITEVGAVLLRRLEDRRE